MLYPIEQKEYSKDPFIRRTWEAAEVLFQEAFTITIFGYGAPQSDADAVELLKSAWFSKNKREIEQVEIIDVAPKEVLHKRWSPFTPTDHITFIKPFDKCWISRCPRRSCEALFYPMQYGLPCEDFPPPGTDSLAEVQARSADIARYE